MLPLTTLAELRVNVRYAIDKHDREAIRLCADEMEHLNTIEARAQAKIVKAVLHQLNGDSEKAMELYELSKEMFSSTDDAIGKGNAEEGIGKLYLFKGEFDNALTHVRKAEELYRSVNSMYDLARILGAIGDVLEYMGDAGSALEYYKNGLHLATTPELASLKATMLRNIGHVLMFIGDLPGALSHMQQAYEEYVRLDNTYMAALASGSLGQLYHSSLNVEASLESYYRALSSLQGMEAWGEAANMKGNIGGVLFTGGRLQEAEQILHEAIKESRDLHRSKEQAYFTEKLCNLLVNMERQDEASIIISDNLALIESFPEPALRIKRIQAHISWRRDDLDSARKLFSDAIEIATARGDTITLYLLHQDLRELCKALGDFEGYILHNEKYSEIYSAFLGHEQQRKLANQQKQHALDAERKEHEKHLAVLHSTLPKHIADRVARGETVNDHFDCAAVMFLDIVGFTTLSSTLTGEQVTTLLNSLFGICDDACTTNGVTRIKTIGDSYMAVAFSEIENSEQQIANANQRIASAALQIIDRVISTDVQLLPVTSSYSQLLQVRIGLHCGPVTAGVLGKERLQYDVWGDTVNVASRMESTGEPNRIHVSEQFAQSLHDVPGSKYLVTGGVDVERRTWNLELRGTVNVKGKGSMQTFWLESSR